MPSAHVFPYHSLSPLKEWTVHWPQCHQLAMQWSLILTSNWSLIPATPCSTTTTIYYFPSLPKWQLLTTQSWIHHQQALEPCWWWTPLQTLKMPSSTLQTPSLPMIELTSLHKPSLLPSNPPSPGQKKNAASHKMLVMNFLKLFPFLHPHHFQLPPLIYCQSTSPMMKQTSSLRSYYASLQYIAFNSSSTISCVSTRTYQVTWPQTAKW